MANIRKTIGFSALGIIAVAIGVWWYFGFSLDFMKFFAAGPQQVAVTPIPCPSGTVVIGSTNSIPPHLICATPSTSPSKTCTPIPSCVFNGPPFCAFDPVPGVNYCPQPSTTPIPTPTQTPDANRVSCAPSTQTVAVGAQATLIASGGTAPYSWFAPRGTPATANGKTFSVSYANSGEKKVTVQAARADGSSLVDSVACTVVVQ